MNPKVSVIIPVYNSEKYIKKCIESIRIQTLKEIEIVLVDDDSCNESSYTSGTLYTICPLLKYFLLKLKPLLLKTSILLYNCLFEIPNLPAIVLQVSLLYIKFINF